MVGKVRPARRSKKELVSYACRRRPPRLLPASSKFLHTRSWKLRPTAARKAAAQVLLCRDEGPLCHGGEICSAVLEKLEWDGGHFPTTPSLSVISTRLLCCTHEDNAVFCYKRGR